MLQKCLLLVIGIVSFCLVLPSSAYAIEDPLTRPNNKIGIHILFDNELPQAAKLVNSNGGDWGYVTIPISIQDMNVGKWQKFMQTAKKHHVIPIVRLVTNPHPTNTAVWRAPTEKDIVAFVNFLDALDWPTKNRYVIIFNEVNRANEWGGTINPGQYAQILSFAAKTFKAKNPDYFVISAGLDNAAPNRSPEFMNQYDYMRAMHTAVPDVFNQVDGLSSHSYPNPAFAQPPDANSMMGIGSFKHERDLIKTLSGKELPVFITETGWSTDEVNVESIKKYYVEAFNTIWNDPNVIAVTPFLMDARGGPFQQFSFISPSGSMTEQYTVLKELLKTKGEPTVPVKVLAAETSKVKPTQKPLPEEKEEDKSFFLVDVFHQFISWIKGS